MKGMRKIIRSNGFRRVLDYAFDHDNARLVGGNIVVLHRNLTHFKG